MIGGCGEQLDLWDEGQVSGENVRGGISEEMEI